jgi:uncharacterized protein
MQGQSILQTSKCEKKKVRGKMIKASFIFLDKIGEQKEKSIWGQGIVDWDGFLQAKNIKGVAKHKKIYYDRAIQRLKKALGDENTAYFYEQSPKHTWRLYPFFKEDTVFVDIEIEQSGIIMIGLYDGREMKTMVKGVNLDKEVLKKELEKYKVMVTFNGGSFDLPRLKKYFGDIPKLPHVDLRHVCSKVGLVGGLKRIEEQLGITRPTHLKAQGESVVGLWKAFHASGDREYLNLLVQYNEEDTANLKEVADKVIPRLWRSIQWELQD